MSPRTPAQFEKLRTRRREQILKVAAEIFIQKGYHAANVSDVAQKAGVSQGTIYHYFPDKENLFLAVYESWEIRNLQSELRDALENAATPTEQLGLLAQMVAKRMEQAKDILPAYTEFWSHIHRNKAIKIGFQNMFKDMRGILARIIRNGIDKNEFVNTEPMTMAAILIAVFDGLILQWIADPKQVKWETIADTLTQVILTGLSANK